MWICPNCGRSFEKKNQGHYCGEAPKSIDEYIAAQPETARGYLTAVRGAVREALPEAQERISWSMPTYWKGKNLIQFAASKAHLGLYPGPEAVDAFRDRLADYPASKGTIRFPYGKPLPLDLIREIAAWCGAHYSPPHAS